MKLFYFQAKDPRGHTQSGTIEASDEKQAALILHGRRFTPVVITAKTENLAAGFFRKTLQRVTLSDLSNFTRQLATMISAGLPITDALAILHTQTENTAFKETIGSILRDIEGGSSVSAALQKYPHIFSKTYIALVRAGEAAGILDNILTRLSESLEKEREFRSKTRGAMVYPTIILITMAGVMFIMMVFVIPKLTSLYKDMGASLPLPTQILISLSDFFVAFWYLIILSVVGLFLGFNFWKKTPAGSKTVDGFILKLPVMGNLQKQILLTEFSRTLGLLVGAGVPILDALKIVSGAMDNVLYREATEEAARKVERGFPLAVPIADNPIFPPVLAQMIRTGEETGKLDEILSRLSLYFESESEHKVKNLTVVLEPFIMIVLGLGVAFLIISIVMPIYKLTSSF